MRSRRIVYGKRMIDDHLRSALSGRARDATDRRDPRTEQPVRRPFAGVRVPVPVPSGMFATPACPSRRAGSGHDAMVADLKAKVFPGEPLKVLALVDGRKMVRVL